MAQKPFHQPAQSLWGPENFQTITVVRLLLALSFKPLIRIFKAYGAVGNIKIKNIVNLTEIYRHIAR